MERHSVAFVMLVVSVINLLLSHPRSDQIPTITTLGLSENVAALQQSILLCSVQVPGEAQWSLYIYKGRVGLGIGTSCRLMWPRQSPEANFCGLSMGDSLWSPGGCE